MNHVDQPQRGCGKRWARGMKTRGPQSRSGWSGGPGDDPGKLVPRNLGLEDTIPLGFSHRFFSHPAGMRRTIALP